MLNLLTSILDSIVVSIPACHAGDRGSIPRRGGLFNQINYDNLFVNRAIIPSSWIEVI